MKNECKVISIDKEQLAILVKESKSYKEILQKMGYKKSGRLSAILRDRIKDLNLDISHFRNYNQTRAIPTIDLLIDNCSYNNQLIKERIIKENLIEYKCSECNMKDEWNGKPLVLQLDHKNGKNNDNRIENLRFLCPNCHSQTDTFSGKNINKCG